MTGKRIAALFVFLVLLLTAGQPIQAVVRLDADSDVSDSAFGRAVGISGDSAIVGACRDQVDDDIRAGSASVFRRGNNVWELEAELTAWDGMPNDFFGHSVAISGDWAVVGAFHHYGTDFGSGAAYVYERRSTGWQPSKKLTAGDGGRNDAFGYSVAMSGDVAVIGAYRAGGKGAAYVFLRGSSGWTQAAKLTASDGRDGDDFGRSVSVSGDRAIVGAIHHGVNGVRSGAAYVYRRDGSRWIEEAKLLPAESGADDFFGFSVSISGDWAVIGASADDDQGTDAGAAYVFQRSGSSWTQYEKLLPSSEASGDFFGRSVALSGISIVVGADGTDKWGANSGAAYIYEKMAGGWEQTAKLTPTDGRTGDRFGWRVAADSGLSGDWFLIGVRDSVPGAAYIHSQNSDGPRIEITPSALTLHQASSQGTGQETRSDADGGDSVENASASGIVVPEAVQQYWTGRMIPPLKPMAAALPSGVDWRRFDSPVKSQGGCGSCWAFAAVALVENLVNQEEIPEAADLSEQTVLACADGGCRGGWYWDALSYISRNGIPSEACHPYEARDNNCQDRCEQPNYLIKIREHTSAMGLWGEEHSVDDMKLALQNGPLIVYMRVPDDGTFEGMGYQGGIYDYQGGSISAQQGHAVLVVGYNDLQKYFLVKNSWGDWWGENGYFRIAYDDVTDHVRFGSYAVTASGAYLEGAGSFVTVANSGTADLIISDIRSNKSWLKFSPSAFLPISSDDRKSLNIFVSDWNAVLNSIDNTGDITIFSNDPARPAISVAITALPGVGWPPSDGPDRGDLNNDDVVDLTDAVIALKIVSGIQVRIPYDLRSDYDAGDVDVNGNNRVDVAEAIYAMIRAAR